MTFSEALKLYRMQLLLIIPLLVVHTHDCQAIRKSRGAEPQKWIDVEWEPEPGKLFNARIRVTAKNSRGALGRIATGISEVGSNIENVSMEEKSPGLYTVLHFIVQVSGRAHLAQLLRRLHSISEVVRITRERE